MFKKLKQNKKAQNTAEYAILISLVVAGIIAMQTYAQRGLQGKVRDAAAYLVNQTGNIGKTHQYEPYYLQTVYDVERDSETTKKLIANLQIGGTRADSLDTRTRAEGGYQQSNYDDAIGEEWR